VKTLFPPYAHPPADLTPDSDTWIVQDRPGARRSVHQVLGRVDLDSGARSLADVLADVDDWRADGVAGLFLDRAPAGPAGVGPVALTIRLAARRGLHRVVLNPGAPADPLYRELGARICTFDGPWSAYRGWTGDGASPGDGHLVHTVPPTLLTAARRLLARRGATFGLATNASPSLISTATAGGVGSEGS